jgi:hypothetical protein
MRKEVCFLIVFIIFGISYSGASVSITNYSNSSIDSYYSNEILSGTLNISVLNEPITSLLRTNLNQSIGFKDFLENNRAAYTCSNYNCSQTGQINFSSSDSSIRILENKSAFFGFYAEGNSVAVTGISFDISSDFGEEADPPLKLKFFDRSYWSFKEPSDNYTRSVSYGCFVPPSLISYPYKIINNSMFCEKISNIPETPSILLGALIQGLGGGTFKMKLLNSNKQEIKTCIFTLPETSCIPSTQSAIGGGDYYVCITSLDSSNYSIAAETNEQNCGWFGSNAESPNTLNSTIDYGIFAQTPRFASAAQKTIDASLVPNLVSDANTYLQSHYNKNCSGGCIIPIEVFGVNQNLRISNVKFQYNTNHGPIQNSSFVALSMIPSNFSFSGQLDLSRANFSVGAKGNKTLQLFFNSQSLLSKSIRVLSSSTIHYVTPLDPPAAVEIDFTVAFDSDRPITKFHWDFGDNATLDSANSTVKHTYSSVGAYTLSVALTDTQNVTVSRDFNITVGSPKELINVTLTFKKNSLSEAYQSLSLLPSWYRPAVERESNISFYQDQIKMIESKRANALTDQDFIDVFNAIFSLTVPYSFSSFQTIITPLVTEIEDISPSTIQDFAGGNVENIDNYKEAILGWQDENINANIKKEKVGETLSDGSPKVILSLFSLNLTSSSSDESYIVIRSDFDSTFFKEDISVKKQGDSALIVLDPYGSEAFSFYVLGDKDPGIFISPKLSKIPIVTAIGACNFNRVCEKDLNENYKNCRSDCFPTGPTIFYFTLLVFLALCSYTALAYWYKTKYEIHLFKDRRALYNILMFITNARISGMTDKQISDELRKQEWNSEQIAYAIKKSKGQRTGLPELIPFDKIAASLRENKARQNQNINKGSIQGINKW